MKRVEYIVQWLDGSWRTYTCGGQEIVHKRVTDAKLFKSQRSWSASATEGIRVVKRTTTEEVV